MQPVTVMITAAGGAGAAGIIACLRDNGERVVRVLAVDADPLAVGLHLADQGAIVPPAHDSAYADALLELCRREGVSVVLPGISYELQRLAGERERFAAAGVKVAVPAPATLHALDNKAGLYDTLARCGVPVADYMTVDSLAALREAAHHFGYPRKRFVLKPALGSGGKGFSVVDATAHPDPEARDRAPYLRWRLEQALAYYEQLAHAGHMPTLVAMTMLDGLEYSVDLLVDRGEALYCLPRTRDVVAMGTSMRARLVNEADIVALCRRMAACYPDYGGNMNIQIKRDAAGRPWPVEINPRLSGTVVFCAQCGVNLPYFGVKYHLGEAIPRVEPRWGKLLIRYLTGIAIDMPSRGA